MSYEWQWYDREQGELHNVVEQGDPCVCEGEDLPHPPRLCARIRERAAARAAALLREDSGIVGAAVRRREESSGRPIDHFSWARR